MALVRERAVPCDTAAMPPAAVTSRISATPTVSSAIVRPSDAPTAVSVPSASPSAVVSALPLEFEVRLTSPVTVSNPPVPISASVSDKSRLMATTGVTAVPPEAPPTAEVATFCWAVALSPRSLTSASKTPSARRALVWLSTTTSATDAPMPRLAPLTPSSSGIALVSTLVSLVAVSERLEPSRVRLAPDATSAITSASTTLMASEPATPVLAPPPAPEVASTL